MEKNLAKMEKKLTIDERIELLKKNNSDVYAAACECAGLKLDFDPAEERYLNSRQFESFLSFIAGSTFQLEKTLKHFQNKLDNIRNE